MAPAVHLKRGLLVFWALLMTFATLTNACDALKAMGVLGSDWTFASGNFPAVVEVMNRYPLPPFLQGVAFAGVIAWELAASVLLWRVAATFRGLSRSASGSLYLALGVLIGLWCAFLLVDEVFMAYAVAGSHRALFTASLLTLLVVILAPEHAD